MSDIHFIDGSHIQVKETPEEIYEPEDPTKEPTPGGLKKCHRAADNLVVLINTKNITHIIPC